MVKLMYIRESRHIQPTSLSGRLRVGRCGQCSAVKIVSSSDSDSNRKRPRLLQLLLNVLSFPPANIRRLVTSRV